MNTHINKSDPDSVRVLSTAFSLLISFFLIAGFTAQTYAANPGVNSNNHAAFSASADTSKVYSNVDEMPEVVGGLAELYKNIKYPSKARASGIEGQVFIQFILDREGNVTNPKIVRDIGGGCGDAAIDALKKVKFTPGKHEGELVKVQFTLPVKFQIMK